MKPDDTNQPQIQGSSDDVGPTISGNQDRDDLKAAIVLIRKGSTLGMVRHHLRKLGRTDAASSQIAEHAVNVAAKQVRRRGVALMIVGGAVVAVVLVVPWFQSFKSHLILLVTGVVLFAKGALDAVSGTDAED